MIREGLLVPVSEIVSRPRWRVGILGATGAVGQKFVRRLDGHPWFEVAALFGSERSVGKRYAEAARWLEPVPLPAGIGAMVVTLARADAPAVECCDLLFSALDAATAATLERELVDRGHAVFTNAGAHRMAEDVPLLVPEINADHLELIAGGGRRGMLVANPNCSTAGLVAALAPLDRRFGVECVQVATLQAVSGAGYPGTASLDILGNAIPWIAGEEEKIESEPRKILGRREGDRILPAPLTISAQAHRVPVLDGHLLAISVRLATRVTPEAARAAFAGYGQPLAALELPSAPHRLIHLLDAPDAPQPRLHANLEGGMAVAVGRLRPCPVFDLRFAALVHNTVRGAAGGAVLTAELLAAQGYLTAK